MTASNTAVSAEADAAAGTKKVNKESKRQKRKIVNPSNTWPQQPKIQSSTARAKAYLRVAGLSKNSKALKQNELFDPTLELDSPEIKFGRLLGGTDQRKRHEAVTKLQMYLKARCDIKNEAGGISELDLMKLWKALWFTLYMADKVPVQDELSKRLSELIWCLAGTEEEDEYAAQAYMAMCGEQDDVRFGFNDDNDVIIEEVVNTLDGGSSSENEEESQEEEEEEEGEESSNKEEKEDVDEESSENSKDEDEEEDDWNVRHCRGAHLASIFVTTFFRTIRREWGNIDKHRVDKFYTLVRLMMKQIYRYMAIRHWNIGIIRLFNDAIYEEVLNKTPNGLRYHLIDLCLEELVHANAKAPMPLTEATFLDCLEPYFAMAQSVQDALVHNRVMTKVLSKFLEDHSVVSQEEADNLEDNEEILDQVHVGSVAQFIFELASNDDTQDRYRQALYDMHKKYMKRLKKTGRDVVLDDGSDAGFGTLHMDDEEDNNATLFEEKLEQVRDTEQEDMKSTSEISKKHKSRKKQPHTENQAEGDEEDESHRNIKNAMESEATTKKKKKRKHKKTSEQNENETRILETSFQAPTADVGDNELKRDDKKKKRRKEKIVLEENQDDEVVITYSEQKVAKAAAEAEDKRKKAAVGGSKGKKKKRKSTEKQDGEKKRVSFGTFNRTKSHKASMKALRTTIPPKTSKTSPESSILLKKGSGSSGTKKRERKHASDYF